MCRNYVDDSFLNSVALSSDCIHLWGDEIVLLSILTGRIILINPKEKMIKKIIDIAQARGRARFRDFAVYKDKIILIPYNCTSSYSVDLNDGYVKKIDIDFGINSDIATAVFLKGIKIGSKLWCIGEKLSKIVCIDLERENLLHEFKYENDVLWSESYLMQEDKLIIPSRNKNVMLIINTKSGEIKIKDITIDGSKEGFGDICVINEKIHLFDLEGLEYQCENKKDYTFLPVDNKTALSASRQSIWYQNKLFRIAQNENCIYVRKPKSNVDEKIQYDLKYKIIGTKLHLHTGVIIENYCILQSRHGEFVCLDMENEACLNMRIAMNEKDLGYFDLAGKEIFSTNIISESYYDGHIGLKDLIDSLVAE